MSTKTCSESTASACTARQYLEGEQAFKDGDPETDCPYSIGDTRRQGFYAGFIAARINARLGRIFEKWGEAPLQ